MPVIATAGMVVRDHAKRVIVVPRGHQAVEDPDTGTIRIEADGSTPGVLGSRWRPLNGQDVPEVEIVGVQTLALPGGGAEAEFALAPVEFGATVVDRHGEEVAIIAVTQEELRERWEPVSPPADRALAEAAAQLETLS